MGRVLGTALTLALVLAGCSNPADQRVEMVPPSNAPAVRPTTTFTPPAVPIAAPSTVATADRRAGDPADITLEELQAAESLGELNSAWADTSLPFAESHITVRHGLPARPSLAAVFEGEETVEHVRSFVAEDRTVHHYEGVGRRDDVNHRCVGYGIEHVIGIGCDVAAPEGLWTQPERTTLQRNEDVAIAGFTIDPNAVLVDVHLDDNTVVRTVVEGEILYFWYPASQPISATLYYANGATQEHPIG